MTVTTCPNLAHVACSPHDARTAVRHHPASPREESAAEHFGEPVRDLVLFGVVTASAPFGS
jgi:hypothetical protein